MLQYKAISGGLGFSDHRARRHIFEFTPSVLISLSLAAGHPLGTCVRVWVSDFVKGHIWGQNLAFTLVEQGQLVKTRDAICNSNLVPQHFS